MNPARLAILGAGGHGKVVADCAQRVGGWSEIVFFDGRWPAVSECLGLPVLGDDAAAFNYCAGGATAFVAIGRAATRLHLLRQLKARGIPLATLIHPGAWIAPSVSIGAGSLVVAGAVINADSRIGEGCIINTGATVDHDSRLADGVHVCPGTHLGGDVTVGEASWLGIGSAVIHGVRIGSRVTLGAGAVVIGDVPDDATVVGVPARPIRKL